VATHKGRHHAPAPDCGCGFNAYHEPRGRLGTSVRGGTTLMVAGAIRARGHIEVHHEGFRAQYAQPIALAYGGRDDPDGERVRQAAAEFGIAAVPLSDLLAFTQEFGHPVPQEMRPEERLSFDPGAVAPGYRSISEQVKLAQRWGLKMTPGHSNHLHTALRSLTP
jgi:hypothetical protein